VQPIDADGNPIPLNDEGEPYDLSGVANPPSSYTDAEGTVIDYYPDLAYVNEVELGRTNVARAPNQVLLKALAEALGTMDEFASSLTVDDAGRISYINADGELVTIDSPLENLALYQAYMLATVVNGDLVYDPDPTKDGDEIILPALPEGATPATLLAASTDKEEPMTLDEIVYLNSILGINVVTEDGTVYWDSSANDDFDYAGISSLANPTVSYLVVTDTGIDYYYNVPLLDAVFGEVTPSVYDANTGSYADAVVVSSGTDWTDPTADYHLDDLVEAAEDARQVIQFLHDSVLIPSS
jgi:hypothetical protein